MDSKKTIDAIAELDAEKLKSYQNMLGFLELIGVKREDLSVLVEVINEWKSLKENCDRNFRVMSSDIESLGESVQSIRNEMSSTGGVTMRKASIMDDFNSGLEELRPDGRKN